MVLKPLACLRSLLGASMACRAHIKRWQGCRCASGRGRAPTSRPPRKRHSADVPMAARVAPWCASSLPALASALFGSQSLLASIPSVLQSAKPREIIFRGIWLFCCLTGRLYVLEGCVAAAFKLLSRTVVNFVLQRRALDIKQESCHAEHPAYRCRRASSTSSCPRRPACAAESSQYQRSSI